MTDCDWRTARVDPPTRRGDDAVWRRVSSGCAPWPLARKKEQTERTDGLRTTRGGHQWGATFVDSRIRRGTNHSCPGPASIRVVDPLGKGALVATCTKLWELANIVLARRPGSDSDARFVQRFCSGRIVSSRQLHSEPLLIVDDREAVLTGLGRYFGLHFERVYVATTPQDAEVILETCHPAVLLCDYWLGDQHPVGTELVRAWRDRYPCIQRVALMSGTKASALGDVSCADAVFQKPLNLKVVTPFLLGKAAQES